MNAFLEFLAALLCITVLGAGVAGIAAVWFAVWLSGNFNQDDGGQVMDETILITVALIIGFIGGALARQSKLCQLAGEKSALIQQCAELFAATLYFQHINQQLGRAMEEAGMQVERIGECDCAECETQWPEEIEVNR